MMAVMFIGDNPRLEAVLDKNQGAPCAVITHPHPLYGGNMTDQIQKNIQNAETRISALLKLPPPLSLDHLAGAHLARLEMLPLAPLALTSRHTNHSHPLPLPGNPVGPPGNAPLPPVSAHIQAHQPITPLASPRSPRIGNGAFAAFLNRKLPTFYRVEVDADIGTSK